MYKDITADIAVIQLMCVLNTYCCCATFNLPSTKKLTADCTRASLCFSVVMILQDPTIARLSSASSIAAFASSTVLASLI